MVNHHESTSSCRPPARKQKRLIWQIATAAFSRLFLNTARRFVYPFAPVLSRGLGVSLTAVTSLIAANQITGILGILFGPLGDRWGYRMMMIGGLGIFSAGMFLGASIPVYWAIFLALFMAGLGKSIFDPATQAYISQKVPYKRRGLAIGAMEMSWAGSSFIGLPLLGILIDQTGWRSPFFALGGLGLIAMLFLALLISDDSIGVRERPNQISLIGSWKSLIGNKAVLGAFGYSFFIGLAYDNFFIIYGLWLNQAFDLGIAAIGTATLVIGVAEFCGEGLTVTVSDRFGLGNSVILGIIISGICYLAIPFVAFNLISALGILFLLFISLEFGIVTSMSLFTEFSPASRATMMSGFYAASSIGRAIGAMIGIPIWTYGGFSSTVVVSASIHGVGMLFILFAIRQYRRNIEV